MLRLKDIEREKSVEQLRRIAVTQHKAIEQLAKALEQKHGPAAAQQALELLATLPLGTPSERSSPAAPAGEDNKPRERKKRTSFGPKAQPALPRVDQTFLLDGADKVCTSCGGTLREMAGQFETSEMIDVVDVQYRVVVVKRQKYSCSCGSCVETALGPDRVVPGGRYSLEFAIKVALDKYLDHLPLTRQVRILNRHGLEVSSQVLWDQVHALGTRLERVSDALLAHVLAQPVIGLDQTSWPKLEAGAQKPWQMWCITAPGVVVHRIRDDKGAGTFASLVGKYGGTIVCDALATHGAGAREGPGIVLAGCWAHVFRKFEEAKDAHPEAANALAWIGALYDLDREAGGDLTRRAKLRRKRAPKILEELRAWLDQFVGLKTLSIGNAARYAVANWARLTRFVDNARVPLDNNATERAIRGPVVGRKNHYGSKSRVGTSVAATLYTIVETAKLHDVDPAAYLAAAVRADADGRALMPWDFAQPPG